MTFCARWMLKLSENWITSNRWRFQDVYQLLLFDGKIVCTACHFLRPFVHQIFGSCVHLKFYKGCCVVAVKIHLKNSNMWCNGHICNEGQLHHLLLSATFFKICQQLIITRLKVLLTKCQFFCRYEKFVYGFCVKQLQTASIANGLTSFRRISLHVFQIQIFRLRKLCKRWSDKLELAIQSLICSQKCKQMGWH